MRSTRLLLVAGAATIVDLVYGTIVYGVLLAKEAQTSNSGIYRSVEQVNANLPWLVAGLFMAMLAASWIFVRGRSVRTPRLIDGLLFGAAMGVFCAGYSAIGNYVVFDLSRRITLFTIIAEFGEWIVVGLTMALLAPGLERRVSWRE